MTMLTILRNQQRFERLDESRLTGTEEDGQ
jgi:hypothetical protein